MDNKQLRKCFAGRLMYALGIRDKTTTGFAKMVNLDPKSLYNYYSGTFPKLQTFYNLCEALNVSADWLLGRTDKMEVNR